MLVLGSLLALPAFADADETKAKALYKDGLTAYDLGEFNKALELYSDAYKLKALPGFLFNIAQCHKQLGNYERAAFFFGRFVDLSPPNAKNVAMGRELAEEMKKKAELERSKVDDARKADEQKRAEEQARTDELKRVELVPTVNVPLLPIEPAPPPPPPPEDLVYKKGWFWSVIVVGALAVAGGTAAAIVLTQPKADAPSLMPPINGR